MTNSHPRVRPLNVIDPFSRPSWFVQEGSVQIHGDSEFTHILIDSALSAVIRNVGRIVIGDQTIGTGLLVAADKVLTNRHVADDIQGAHAKLDLIAEQGRTETDLRSLGSRIALPIDDVVDIALLSVETTHSEEALAWGAATEDQPVAAIGFPSDEHSTVPEVQEAIRAIFGEEFDVKRVSPGRVLSTEEEVTHDASTLGGSSGSPVVDLTTGQIVGIHFFGDFDRNRAIPGPIVKAALDQVL